MGDTLGSAAQGGTTSLWMSEEEGSLPCWARMGQTVSFPARHSIIQGHIQHLPKFVDQDTKPASLQSACLLDLLFFFLFSAFFLILLIMYS